MDHKTIVPLQNHLVRVAAEEVAQADPVQEEDLLVEEETNSQKFS